MPTGPRVGVGALAYGPQADGTTSPPYPMACSVVDGHSAIEAVVKERVQLPDSRQHREVQTSRVPWRTHLRGAHLKRKEEEAEGCSVVFGKAEKVESSNVLWEIEAGVAESVELPAAVARMHLRA